MDIGRVRYLDGLKALACVFIMLGHMCGLYKYSSDLTGIKNGFMDMLTHFPLDFFTDENYWLCLFLVISGYLAVVTMKKKLSVEQLLGKVFSRFWRLALPIFFSDCVVLALQAVIGFHNLELEPIIHNAWFTSCYGRQLTVTDLLMDPFRTLFKGESLFIPPYWCLREIFFGTVIGYWLNDLRLGNMDRSGVMSRSHIICFALAFFVLFLLRRPLIMVVLVGVFIAWLERAFSYVVSGKIKPMTFRLILMFGFASPFLAYYVSINSIVNGVCFGIFLLCIPYGVAFLGFLSRAALEKIGGGLSWGIFSYHWPVVSSIGAIVMIRLYGVVNDAGMFVVMMACCLSVVVLLSVLDWKVLEPLACRIRILVKEMFERTPGK